MRQTPTHLPPTNCFKLYCSIIHGETKSRRNCFIQPYACDTKLNYADESQRNGWLNVTEDFVYYDGVYYGDWSVFTELSDDLKERLVDFEQSKAESPQNCWYLIRLHGGIEP